MFLSRLINEYKLVLKPPGKGGGKFRQPGMDILVINVSQRNPLMNENAKNKKIVYYIHIQPTIIV